MTFDQEDMDYIQSKLQSNTLLEKYLIKNRGLKRVPKGWGFVPRLQLANDLQTIPASIAIPILSIDKKVTGYEFRAISDLTDIRYTKIFTKGIIPIYNLINPRYGSKVLITEGSIDCEIIYQNSKLNVISTTTASIPQYVLHILAFFFREIYVMFDNDKDSTGLLKSKDVKKFYKKYYSNVTNCNIIDFSKYSEFKDIGAVKDLKKRLKIIKRIEGIIND